MNELLSQLGGRIDAMFFCPHGPKDGCDCRKPRPGMLTDIGNRFQAKLGDVMFVGDNINDVKAAKAAGARPVLVRTGKGEQTVGILAEHRLNGIPVYDDLAGLVNTMLEDNK
jgi:D-glycero-D-manno-heptose 1,7-bisphosphate phosphatase